MWLIFSMLSALTAAFMTIAGKIGLKDVDPMLASCLRALVMLIFLSILILIEGKYKGISNIDHKAFWTILYSAIFGALSWLFYFLALRHGTTSKVAAIDKLSLILIVIFSVFFLAEKITLKMLIGSLIATFGIILIALG